MTDDPDVLQARAFFPRGLVQPETGWRFSLDALLLGAFARPRHGSRVLDLGCGCGPAGFAMLLRDPRTRATVTGLDVDPDMVRAARENAARLGLSHCFAAHVLDVRQTRALARSLARETVGTTGEPPDPETVFRPAPESVEHVLCNPPYRPVGSGRSCPGEGRNRARFESTGTLADFLDAAAFFLTNKGTAWFVHLASRLAALLAGLAASGLEPKRLLPVYSRLGGPARLILVEAIKNSGPGLVLEPPLPLYREETDQGSRRPRLTDQALALCPFLAANA